MKIETKIQTKKYELIRIKPNGINLKKEKIGKTLKIIILNENTNLKIDKKEEKITIYLSGDYDLLSKQVRGHNNNTKGHIYLNKEYWGHDCIIITP